MIKLTKSRLDVFTVVGQIQLYLKFYVSVEHLRYLTRWIIFFQKFRDSRFGLTVVYQN